MPAVNEIESPVERKIISNQPQLTAWQRMIITFHGRTKYRPLNWTLCGKCLIIHVAFRQYLFFNLFCKAGRLERSNWNMKYSSGTMVAP